MPKLEVVKEPAPAPAKKAAAKKATAPVKAAAKKATTAPALEAQPKASLLSGAVPLTDEREHINTLWMGDQGTGKTTNLTTMANDGDLYVVNAEGGLKKRALTKMGVDVERVKLLPADKDDLTVDFLEDLYWELKAELASPDTNIAGVGWDSVTEIVKVMTTNVAEYRQRRAEARGEARLVGASPGDMVDRAFVDLDDYGIMSKQVVKLLRRYIDLPCHFGMTALLRRDKDSDGAVVYRPDVTPALQSDLQGKVDIVAVCTVHDMSDGGEDEYRGLFRPLGMYRGKDRFKAIPKYLIDPTFARIRSYVNEDMDLDSDPVMQEARARRGKAPQRAEADPNEPTGDEEPTALDTGI